MKLIKLKLNCITLKQFLIKKKPGGIVPIIEYLPTTPSPPPQPRAFLSHDILTVVLSQAYHWFVYIAHFGSQGCNVTTV